MVTSRAALSVIGVLSLLPFSLQLPFTAPQKTMGWDLINLNDGTSIPSIAFGTWTLGRGQNSIDQVEQAIDTGFNHIDTAQSYRNEEEAGKALHLSGLSRSDVYITTKYSGTNGLDIKHSIHASLENLGVSYVDLYLIHSPRLATPDIPTAWATMEEVVRQGHTKSIGVSNFNVAQLQTLMASAKIKPVANQILFHPYVYEEQKPILEYCAKHGIVVEAYSALTPLTHQVGGPVDAPVKEIAIRLEKTPEQILLAWAKAKGTVLVTTSSKGWRLEDYLDAGNIELTDDDIAAIDEAGTRGAKQSWARTALRRLAGIALVGAGVLGICNWMGIRLL